MASVPGATVIGAGAEIDAELNRRVREHVAGMNATDAATFTRNLQRRIQSSGDSEITAENRMHGSYSDWDNNFVQYFAILIHFLLP